jgi:DNA gyrase subunit A
LEVDKIENELAELERQIADFKDILAHEYRVLQIIKEDLLVIKSKFPSERKTEIAANFDGDILDADLIPVEQVVVSITHSGYAKRLPVDEYKAQNRGGKGITAHRPKEEDFVEQMFVCSSHDNLLMFSNLGKVYVIRCFEIPEAARTARGRALINLVQLDQNEKINTVIPVSQFSEGYIVFATKKGLIKKTATSEFARIQKNGKIAIKINEGDELITAALTTGDNEIMIASSYGKCIRFHESGVRAMGRGTAGVRAMRLTGKDALVDMLVVDPTKDMLTVTAQGYGKRSDLEDYRIQGRAGKGIKASVLTEATGNLVCLKQVTAENDLMVITDSGVIIRMHVSDISKIGRNTKGVHLMRIKDGSVATIAVTERAEDEEVTAPEEVATPEMLAQAGENEEDDTLDEADDTVDGGLDAGEEAGLDGGVDANGEKGNGGNNGQGGLGGADGLDDDLADDVADDLENGEVNHGSELDYDKEDDVLDDDDPDDI